MSLERSSLDTWLFLAVPRVQLTNLDNITVSYYNKGEVVGVLLDLEIRARTNNSKNLDDVFRYMYQEYYENSPANSYYLKGRGFTQVDFLQAVNKIAETDFTSFFNAYVKGTQEIDYNQFLAYAGLRLEEKKEKNGTLAYTISEVSQATTKQLMLRKSWLGGNNN
jgi:predicted metalloprotease with PDZ domain